MSRWKVVDLGCKRAGATDEFLRAGAEFFPGVADIRPSECLCYDNKFIYRSDVEAKGYRFRGEDLREHIDYPHLSNLPVADFYLLWDFLEHLPDPRSAAVLLRLALGRARVAVWVRMPSFESDTETGEGRLRPSGLRFAWTRWKGHPNPFTLADLDAAVAAGPVGVSDVVSSVGAIVRRPVLRFASTADSRIVLEDEPVDTVHHDPGFGAKPILSLDPPVIGQWDVTIALKPAHAPE